MSSAAYAEVERLRTEKAAGFLYTENAIRLQQEAEDAMECRGDPRRMDYAYIPTFYDGAPRGS